METYQSILQKELLNEGYVNAQDLIINAGSHCVEQVFEDTAERYADQFKPKWIPVACGYPDHFNPVLGKFIASNGDEHYHIVSLYVTRHCKTIFTDIFGESQISITEWMEIPTSAPERKEEVEW